MNTGFWVVDGRFARRYNAHKFDQRKTTKETSTVAVLPREPVVGENRPAHSQKSTLELLPKQGKPVAPVIALLRSVTSNQ